MGWFKMTGLATPNSQYAGDLLLTKGTIQKHAERVVRPTPMTNLRVANRITSFDSEGLLGRPILTNEPFFSSLLAITI